MSDLLKEIVAEAAIDRDSVALEALLDTSNSTTGTPSMEGFWKAVMRGLKNWKVKREQAKAEQAVRDGKTLELATKLQKYSKKLEAKINRLPAGTVVEIDISKQMAFFAVDGRVATNIVGSIERNTLNTARAVEKLKARTESLKGKVAQIAQNADLSSDEKFEQTVLSKLSDFTGSYLQEILPNTEGNFMNGVSVQVDDVINDFKRATGVEQLQLLYKSSTTTNFKKTPAPLGAHRVKLTKADLQRLVRCMQQNASLVTPQTQQAMGEASEDLFMDQVRLFDIESQEEVDGVQVSQLERFKDALPSMQAMAMMVAGLLEFTFFLLGSTILVAVATKSVIEEALSAAADL